MESRIAYETYFPLVAYDVETTGLDRDNDEVIEVCFIEFNERGEVGRGFHSLCEPFAGYIPTEASEIHGIMMSDVRGKPNYFDIRENVVDFVAERKFGGHNSDWFDLEMIKIAPDGVETFDTMVMGVEKFHIRDGRISLRQLCGKVGIKFDKKQAHRAEYDVLMCIKAYCALVRTETEALMNDIPFWETKQVGWND